MPRCAPGRHFYTFCHRSSSVHTTHLISSHSASLRAPWSDQATQFVVAVTNQNEVRRSDWWQPRPTGSSCTHVQCTVLDVDEMTEVRCDEWCEHGFIPRDTWQMWRQRGAADVMMQLTRLSWLHAPAAADANTRWRHHLNLHRLRLMLT